MKLNSDIIYDNLSQLFEIQRYGPKDESLTLGRPVLYEPNTDFNQCKVYVARYDMLPSVPQKTSGEMVVCIGGMPPTGWLDGYNSILVIQNLNDLHGIFNLIQSLFNRYDEWNELLLQIIEQDADILKMVYQSIHIFENQITVVDKNLKILARNVHKDTEGDSPEWEMTSGDTVPAKQIYKLKEIYNKKLQEGDRKKPLLYNYGEIIDGGQWGYRINIYLEDNYEGCVTLSAITRPFRQSEFVLLNKFSEYVKKALSIRYNIMHERTMSARSVIKDLLNSLPVDNYRLNKVLEPDMSESPRWVCMKVQYVEIGRFSHVDYICASFDNLFPRCISIPLEAEIVTFIRLRTEASPDSIVNTVSPFLTDMDIQIGLSIIFEDIKKVRGYYRQACCALETGNMLQPGKRVYRFEDFALPYMLLHCSGELASEDMLSNRIAALKKYDQASAADYWTTLRVYLDNEMNAAKTAKILYLHRSTLLQRLSRINEFIGEDLKSPAGRMYIRMCMYMLDY